MNRQSAYLCLSAVGSPPFNKKGPPWRIHSGPAYECRVVTLLAALAAPMQRRPDTLLPCSSAHIFTYTTTLTRFRYLLPDQAVRVGSYLSLCTSFLSRMSAHIRLLIYMQAPIYNVETLLSLGARCRRLVTTPWATIAVPSTDSKPRGSQTATSTKIATLTLTTLMRASRLWLRQVIRDLDGTT